MFLDDVILYLTELPACEESTPFGPEVLVYKVGGKMFAATNPDDVPNRVNLKCDPDRSIELREAYPAIQPGYHMNKRHWNTLALDNTIPPALLAELIDHSYQLVVSKLTKAQRATLSQ